MNLQRLRKHLVAAAVCWGRKRRRRKKNCPLLVVDQKRDEQCEGRPAAQMVFFSTAGDKRIHLPAQDGTF